MSNLRYPRVAFTSPFREQLRITFKKATINEHVYLGVKSFRLDELLLKLELTTKEKDVRSKLSPVSLVPKCDQLVTTINVPGLSKLVPRFRAQEAILEVSPFEDKTTGWLTVDLSKKLPPHKYNADDADVADVADVNSPSVAFDLNALKQAVKLINNAKLALGKSLSLSINDEKLVLLMEI